MEIKNFLFIVASVLTINACQTTTTSKSDVAVPTQHSPATQGTSTNTPTQTTSPSLSESSAPVTEHAPTPPIVKVPKIGVILGPGAFRSFAHIGVLQELTKAKMPIDFIVGLEWGAWPAGLFAQGGMTNEVEWQMTKPNLDQIFKTSLLNKEFEPVGTREIEKMVEPGFLKSTLEQARIPFACPALQLSKKQFVWIKKGSFTQGLSLCMTFPPLSQADNGYLAVQDMKIAIDYLKKAGAEFIIYVNVLPTQSTEWNIEEAGNTTFSFWNYLMAHNNRYMSFVDHMIEVTGGPRSPLDKEDVREYIRIGRIAGEQAAQKLAKKLKF